MDTLLMLCYTATDIFSLPILRKKILAHRLMKFAGYVPCHGILSSIISSNMAAMAIFIK